ncbi:hypothetical protein TNCV_123661 [Trichonephila clavipes]|nr:hypothetical protein TNCV_123661 [Trichonephila clavipes]
MSSFLVLREGDTRNRTKEAERDFCDLPIRRDEGRVVNTPLVFKRVLFQEKKRREREREEPSLGWRKGKSLPWIKKRENPCPGWRKHERRSPGWNGREESAKEKGLVRDRSGKTMSASGVENRI